MQSCVCIYIYILAFFINPFVKKTFQIKFKLMII